MNSATEARGDYSKTADILVIEDQPAFIHALRAYIPFTAMHSVPTLRAGLEALKEREWRKVLLDLDLPDSKLEMTINLIPSIKQICGSASLVVMTGFGVDAEKVQTLGAVAVLEKTDHEFPQLLRALLR